MRPSQITALAAAVALMATGCGSGEKAPTKAEYGRNASRVCAQLEKKTNDAARGNPSSAEEIGVYADRVGKALGDGVEAIDNVERPAGKDGEKAKAYVDELRRQVDREVRPALGELKAAARRRDGAGVQAAAQKIRDVDSTKLKRLAREAGATGCAT